MEKKTPTMVMQPNARFLTKNEKRGLSRFLSHLSSLDKPRKPRKKQTFTK